MRDHAASSSSICATTRHHAGGDPSESQLLRCAQQGQAGDRDHGGWQGDPREPSTINPEIPTGEVELVADECIIEAASEQTPLYLPGDEDGAEDLRLKYRFLDLRRERVHNNILLRSKIISFLRKAMETHGFNEYQTPILTCSSPEGARDYLVPSRVHHGKFYALPQAPQLFKQLLNGRGLRPLFSDRALLPR
jgi:aspartyl-tRNA synthetase